MPAEWAKIVADVAAHAAPARYIDLSYSPATRINQFIFIVSFVFPANSNVAGFIWLLMKKKELLVSLVCSIPIIMDPRS
jgi:hypothetical protein